MLLIILILLTARSTLQQDETPSAVVETSLGKIQGTVMKSQYGGDILAFRGIPYAQPPIGNLRFRAPLPVLPWSDTLKATSDSLVCPQTGIQLLMTEDCLKLNVFSRDLRGRSPVMVYIHGGANVLGSGNSIYEAGPQYLLDHDVVLVAFNYRLGALGFLSTQTEEAPGNYGYLDQVLALKWVKEHIAHFGGNPNLVTIFGLSAGSMAVTLHMASPLSRGLFHRAIAMSGSATNHYSIDNVAWTRKLAREVSCPMYNPGDVVDCLRNVTWKKIVSTCSEWEPYGFTNMKWNYEIDNNFLHEHPSTSFLHGNINRVPMIVGLTKNELDFSIYHQENNTGLLNDIGVSFDSYAPEIYLYNATDNDFVPKRSERIHKFYFGNQATISKSNLEEFGKTFSDAIIGHGVHRLVRFAQTHIDVYYYRMDYEGKRSLYTTPELTPRGVGHADDIQYVMPGLWYGTQMKPDDPDMFMVNRTVSLWTSFAKDGIPHAEGVSEWAPCNVSTTLTLYNDKETHMDKPPYQDRYELWDELFPYGLSDADKVKYSVFIMALTYSIRHFF